MMSPNQDETGLSQPTEGLWSDDRIGIINPFV